MSWDYAELSKNAKKYGGPEKYINFLFERAKEAAKKEISKEKRPIELLYIGIGIGIGTIGKVLFDFYKKKQEISREEVENVKQELIQGIKDYDKECLEDSVQKIDEEDKEEKEEKDIDNN